MNVLAWPSQSLDLNPIENMWNDIFDIFIEAYPNRLKAVIKAKGGSTKY